MRIHRILPRFANEGQPHMTASAWAHFRDRGPERLHSLPTPSRPLRDRGPGDMR